jgi:hypothetical protein
MKGEEERVLLLAGREEERPEEGAPGQIERTPRLRPRQAPDLLFPPRGGKSAEVDPRQRQRAVPGDHLPRLAGHALEGRAQSLVPPHDLAEGGGERPCVQTAVEADGGRDVVRRAPRLELVEEPEPLLAERERQHPGAGDRLDLRHLQPPAGPHRLLDDLAEAGDRRRLEHRGQRQLDPERLAHPRGELGGEERVPSEVEEAVLDAHPLDGQHLAEDRRQQLLDRRPRRAVDLRLPLGGGQGLPVHLAVGGQRQGGQTDEGRRDHVVGQADPDEGGEICRGGLEAVPRHDVGHQAPVPGPVLAHRGNHLAHRRVLIEGGFDLSQLDAEAADLDLLVEPAQELDGAVGAEAGPVAGAVHHRPRPCGEGVRQVLARGQERSRGIAVREALAADVEIPRNADRRGRERAVQDIVAGVLDRPPVGDALPARIDRLHRVGVGPHGRLGGAAQRDHPRAGEARPHLVGQGERHPVAGEKHQAQVAAVASGRGLRQERRELRQRRRRRVPEGDRLAAENRGQAARILELVLGDHPDAAAGGEQAEDVVDREVEAERGDEQHPVGRPHPERRVDPVEEVEDRPVADHDPLGPAGGAGGEDHVGQVVPRGGGPGAGARPAGKVGGAPQLPPGRQGRAAVLRLAVQADHVAQERQLGQEVADARQEGAAGQEHPDVHGREDPAQTVLGVSHLQRQVGGAGLEDTQEGGDHLRGAFEEDRHQGARPDFQPPQVVGQAVGRAVELAVTDFPAARDHGDRIGAPRRLPFEELVNTGRERREGRGGVVPLDEALLALRVGEQGDGRQGERGMVDPGAQEVFEMADQPPYGRGVEEVAVVFDRAADPFRPLAELEREIELRRLALQRQGAQGEARQLDTHFRRVLEGEDHLEQRRAGEVALRLQLFDQLFERQVLVGVRRARPVLDAGEELAQRGIARQIRAKDQGVDQEADQPLGLELRAAGDGRPDQNVPLARVAAEQPIEGGEQGHEEGRPLPLGQGLEAGGQLPGKEQRHRAAPGAQHRRPRTVGRQVQDLGSTGEPLPPPGDLALEELPGQPLALPQREVRVLDGQRGQGGGRALGALGALSQGAVEGGHLADEDPERPAVGDDVVHRRQERPELRFEPHQGQAQQRAQRQVERRECRRMGKPRQLRAPRRSGERAEVEHRQVDRRARGDRLHRLPLPRGNGEAGAQALVAADHRVDRRREDRRRQGSGQLEGAPQVVGGASGVEPIEEPEPLLAEGKRGDRSRSAAGNPPRRGLRPGDALARVGARPLAQAPQEEPPLLGGQLLEEFRKLSRQGSSAPDPRFPGMPLPTPFPAPGP